MKSLTESSPSNNTLAVVRGEAVTALPNDLYIPPEALRVFLETFEGPLDLLLYLIKKQNLDILDIPLAEITRQYMEYVEIMQEFHLELAAEYLVMAAFLAEIKSRMLLPKPPSLAEGDEKDPRSELIRRLQEYERFKKAGEDLDQLPRIERDIFVAKTNLPVTNITKPLPKADLKELFIALIGVLERARLNEKHVIQLEPLSIRERMTSILSKIKSNQFIPFTDLFSTTEGRMGVVVSFIAILELIRQSIIEMTQAEPFSPIYIRAAAN
jgi:segregation and condensation protein A